MNSGIRRSAFVVLAAGLVGCATTGQPPPTQGPPLTCDSVLWDRPIPETQAPGEWKPEHRRAYVHIRFVTDGEHVYAVVIPVVNLAAETIYVVGPMKDLKMAPPETEETARAAAAQSKDWTEFYGALFRAYRHSRPMGLVCPGRDCPITPEGPPPQLFGMTVGYGGSSTGALEVPQSSQALAELAASTASTTATDALRPPVAPAQRSTDQERERRALVSDVVTRATCAAKILAGSR